MIRELPYDELERLHRQGRQALRDALRDGDVTAYRHAEQLKRKTRREKIRRCARRLP